ncbi:MAG: hypothetical protein CL674_15740 [Bdellovibrionaceae bacterium]|nr:hypothetical protein [Pseudobdellovibrionaceae bacterium]|tara:strand:- start:12613 stop:13239 length:627 start_codon:yes stop_codon:yes gene_type:complete
MKNKLVILAYLLFGHFALAQPLSLESGVYRVNCVPDEYSCEEKGFICAKEDTLNFDLYQTEIGSRVENLTFSNHPIAKLQMQSEYFEAVVSFRFISGFFKWNYGAHFRFTELNKRTNFKALLNRVAYTCSMYNKEFRNQLASFFDVFEQAPYIENRSHEDNSLLEESCERLSSYVKSNPHYAYDSYSQDLVRLYSNQYCSADSSQEQI